MQGSDSSAMAAYGDTLLTLGEKFLSQRCVPGIGPSRWISMYICVYQYGRRPRTEQWGVTLWAQPCSAVTCTYMYMYRPTHIGYGSVQSCTIARIVYVFIFGYSCSLLMLRKSYINPFGYHRLFIALRIVQLRKYIHTVLTFIHVRSYIVHPNNYTCINVYVSFNCTNCIHPRLHMHAFTIYILYASSITAYTHA